MAHKIFLLASSTPVTGAASRPIAGKHGSHRYSACLKAGDIPVGAGLPAMRPALTAELWISVRLGSIAAGHDRLLTTHCSRSRATWAAVSVSRADSSVCGVVHLLKFKLLGSTGLKVCTLFIQVPIDALQVGDLLLDLCHLFFN